MHGWSVVVAICTVDQLLLSCALKKLQGPCITFRSPNTDQVMCLKIEAASTQYMKHWFEKVAAVLCKCVFGLTHV